MNKTKSKTNIQVKPQVSTRDAALRGVLHRKLLNACQDVGGDIAAIAEDGVTPWRYAGAAVGVINAPFEFARVSDTPETIYANFMEWLDLPEDESAAILEAVERNELKLDPATAPPHLVTEEAKND